MACINKIATDVLNSCAITPRAGYESIAWALNLGTFSYTIAKNLVTNITMDPGNYAYQVTAMKKEMGGGFNAVISDEEDRYIHDFSFKPYEKDPASIVNIDQSNALVVIVELKGVKEEGAFLVLGLQTGMYKNSATQRQNDNNGLPIYNFRSIDYLGEKYSRWVLWDTDYDTTLAMINVLTETRKLTEPGDRGLLTPDGRRLVI